jgi:hypothetical protein
VFSVARRSVFAKPAPRRNSCRAEDPSSPVGYAEAGSAAPPVQMSIYEQFFSRRPAEWPPYRFNQLVEKVGRAVPARRARRMIVELPNADDFAINRKIYSFGWTDLMRLGQ